MAHSKGAAGNGWWAGCLAAVVFVWLLSAALSLSSVLASVTIAGFEVEAGEQEVFVYWETASETDNLGFYVWRSENADSGYEKLPIGATESEQIIPSEDDGFGAFYEFTDEQVTPGILYYYKVQDFPASGSPEFVGPESTGIDLTSEPTTSPPDTETPTATSTPTLRPTSTAMPNTSTPLPDSTSTPVPDVRFWAEASSLAAGDCTTVQWYANNVRSVYFDGAPVQGQGARTFCPCENETHVLDVTYTDDASEQFTVELTVSGSCDESTLPSSPLATPTLLPTVTPVPATATSEPTVSPTALAETPFATATPRDRRGDTGAQDSPLPTPTLGNMFEVAVDEPDAPGAVAVSEGAESEDVGPQSLSEGVVVEGLPTATRLPVGMLLVAAAVAGIGLMLGGLWLWKRE